MIIYFSATGNSQYVSKKIAKEINEKTYSIIENKNTRKYHIHIEKDETLGVVIPTYFWELPTIVEEYLSKLTITSENKNPYIYIITTYGTTPGYSAGYVKEHLNRCGYKVNLQASIKMVDTWTVMFDLTGKEKIKQQTIESDKEIDTIITRIKNRNQGKYVARKIPKFISNMAQLWYDRSRKTKNLHITKTCTGCKKCINNCPINAITLVNNKPSWQKEYCVMCLRCLHICPTFSIQYNNKTQKHGQYINPYIKKLD